MTGFSDASLFGLPDVIPQQQADDLVEFIRQVWRCCYTDWPSADIDVDLEKCARFYDPVARGLTIRERLASVEPAPMPPNSITSYVHEPTFVEVDKSRLLVGIEARLVLEIIEGSQCDGQNVMTSHELTANADALAAGAYRSLSIRRLRQVIDLRRGRGKEAMQPVSLGFLLAMLVGRSTDVSRAVSSSDDAPANRVLFAAIEAFAECISGRGRRSVSENKVKSGYAITEARRRLGDVIRFEKSEHGRILYLAPDSESIVRGFVAHDLARRRGLTVATVGEAFDSLVAAYRREARRIALEMRTFERSADTARLRVHLLEDYRRAREEAQ